MRPLVTICMVTYNAEKWIAQAIESVLAQTYRDFELLVVNDGSTDKTEKIIKSYSDERIRYIYQEHKNFAAGMNRAIAEVQSEFIFDIGSDDFIAQDYLEKMVNFAEQYPNIDYFYPDHFTLVDEDGNLIGTRWNYQDFSDGNEVAEFLLNRNFSPIPHPGSLKRKTLFDRVGLYDEVETCEDFAFLCKNARKIRFKRVNDSSEYFYRRLPSSNSRRLKERKEVHAKALSEIRATSNKTKLLVCSPWDNCWLRYFERYFKSKSYEVTVCRYNRKEPDKVNIDWADIVLFNWTDSFLQYWSNQEKNKAKKYIAFLRSYELWDTQYPWLIKWENVDHLIFINNAIQQCFLANVPDLIKGGFNIPTHFIPNAIDLDEWKFVDRKPNKKIAWVNDLCYKKGVQLLAQFAFHMPYDYTLYPAGTRGDRRTGFYFDSITRSLRVENRIAPIKHYTDVQQFLADKSYTLCTSIVEGHPNALIEAMSVGIRPLIHNFPGSKDLFPEKYIYNTIEEAVEMLNGDYCSREYRDFIEENYDIQKVYPRIEELF